MKVVPDAETSSAARWDKRYRAAVEPPFGEAPNEYLRMILARPDFRAASALCLADGDGRNGAWLAEQGLAVTAVDVSGVATERALALDARRGVSVERVTADLAAWAPHGGRQWQAVFIIYLQGTGALRRRALEVGAAALAPGGWLVLEGFAKAQAGRPGMGPDDPDRLYDLKELHAALPDLEIVEVLAGRVLLSEGTRHSGAAEIVRFAARRPGRFTAAVKAGMNNPPRRGNTTLTPGDERSALSRVADRTGPAFQRPHGVPLHAAWMETWQDSPPRS